MFRCLELKTICMFDFIVLWSTICPASISNEFNINAGVESCTSWTEPAKAYVWYASVCPTNPFGDHNP